MYPTDFKINCIMKTLISAFLLLIALLHFGCSEDADPVEVQLPISGKWLYKDNIEPGCDSLIGSIVEIRGKSARIVSVPPNSSEFEIGDTLFSDIKTNHTEFLATGYISSPAGWLKSNDIKVRIIFSGSGQEMHIIYSGTDCNAKQHWVKEP